ncbi:MAG: hypothetical protein E7359_03970 [Clostridiales bacterium]|nr:hypothetical protein [Clostridiales bacterium]
MNVLDIVLIVFILIIAIIGFSKGFLNSLLSLISNLLTFVGAFFAAKPLTSLLNKIFGLASTIGNSLSSQISSFFTDFTNLSGAEVLANKCTADGLLRTAFSLFIKPETIYASDEALASSLSSFAGNVVTMAISMVIAFIIIRLIIFFLAKIFDALKKKSLAINGLDKTIGLILGIVKGLIFFAIVCVVANLLQTVPAVADALDTVFTGSNIAKPLYDFITGFVNNYISQIDFNTLLSGMI